MEDARLARGRLRRRGAIPFHEAIAAAANPGGHPRRQPDPDRVAEDGRRQAVDLDDEEPPAARDARRLLRRQAAGQLGVERVVAVGRDHDRDQRREDRDDDRGGEGAGERGDLEARHEWRRQGQHHRVDHEREQPDGRHVQRQGEEDDHRPHEGVQEAEDDGGEQRRGEAAHEDPGHEVAHEQQHRGLDDPVEEDPPPATDAQPLPGDPDRGRPGVADRSQEAHAVAADPGRGHVGRCVQMVDATVTCRDAVIVGRGAAGRSSSLASCGWAGPDGLAVARGSVPCLPRLRGEQVRDAGRRERADLGKQPDRGRHEAQQLVRRRAAVEEVADRGVVIGLGELGARRLPQQRVVEEGRRGLAAQQAAEAELGRGGVEQVAAADDEVDAVAEVVDDDAERVAPVAVAVAQGEVAAGRGVARLRAEQEVVERLLAGAEPRAEGAPGRVLGQRALAAPARAAGPAPGEQRGARARAGVDAALRAESCDRGRVRRRVVGLAERRRPRPAARRAAARPGAGPAAPGRRGARSRTSAGSAGGRDPRSAGSPARRSRGRSPRRRSR